MQDKLSDKMDDKIKKSLDKDLELVLLCKNEDINAFEALVERHQKKMFNIAYRMTDNYEDASDIVQETFISAFKSIKKFKGESLFSTWLTSILINHAKNRLKRIKNISHHEDRSTDGILEMDENSISMETPSLQTPVVEQLEQKEIQVEVQKCINALDETSREIVILREIQGFSYDEVSRILKMPEGTIKSRLFRARDSLRICLKKALGDL